MIWIVIIVMFLVVCFVVANSATEQIKTENNNKFSNLGYHYIDLIGVNYKGGIKNISINSPAVSISLLQEGINFNTGIGEKTILFKNIEDMFLQSQQYIQDQVSLGKLIVFGVLAFGMNKKHNTINDEYVVLKVNDEDGEYNVIIQAYESIDNQKVFNTLSMHRNNSCKILAKESI